MEARGVVTYELRDDVALVGLNRPSKCNAVNKQMTEELSGALTVANRKAKVCILFGHGNHFSAGLDLEWMRTTMGEGLAEGMPVARNKHDFVPMQIITRSPIPYIAAIQGAAVGLGFELAAATHIRVADGSARFSLPEGRRGIFLGAGGSARISRLIGVARMQDMMLTGRTYDASEAVQCNIAQYAVPVGNAVEKAIELAREVCKNSAESNMSVLQGLPRISEMSIEDGIFWENIIARTTFGKQAISRMSEFLDGPTNPG